MSTIERSSGLNSRQAVVDRVRAAFRMAENASEMSVNHLRNIRSIPSKTIRQAGALATIVRAEQTPVSEEQIEQSEDRYAPQGYQETSNNS